jgi:hypothetical protein
MRVIRSHALPAVVLVKGPGVCAVVIPDSLHPDEVLELASLVLSATEYEEVREAVRPGPPASAVAAAGPGTPTRSG